MKDELRIAVAEAMGWVWYRMPEHPSDTRRYRCLFHPSIHEYEGQSPKWLVRADGTEGICNMAYMEKEGHVPELSLDLFADARKGMTPAERDEYLEFLMDSIGEDHGSWEIMLGLLDATVEQHAQAVLAVKLKGKGEK